jgi:hypothetical protein
MHIVGSFIEDLTRTQVLERASSCLHLYFAVQHIHERVGVMTVNGVYGLADPAYYTLLVADAAYSY